jgi:ditrans,polycis-polyprenyl diphosphate synthase
VPGAELDDSISSSATLHPDSVENSDVPNPDEPSYPDPESITAATVESHLFTAGNPPLDLLIRTSGVNRLSDFMMWQCHEDTQLRFLDCYWPEFSLRHFLPVLIEWQWQRKYGDDKEGGAVKARPKSAKMY